MVGPECVQGLYESSPESILDCTNSSLNLPVCLDVTKCYTVMHYAYTHAKQRKTTLKLRYIICLYVKWLPLPHHYLVPQEFFHLPYVQRRYYLCINPF